MLDTSVYYIVLLIVNFQLFIDVYTFKILNYKVYSIFLLNI